MKITLLITAIVPFIVGDELCTVYCEENGGE